MAIETEKLCNLKHLLWREVAEDGAGNGFRDFVHV